MELIRIIAVDFIGLLYFYSDACDVVDDICFYLLDLGLEPECLHGEMSIQQVVLSFLPLFARALSLLLDLLDEVVQVHDLLEVDAVAFIDDPDLLLGPLPLAQVAHDVLHLGDLLVDQLHNPSTTFFLRSSRRYSLWIFFSTLF